MDVVLLTDRMLASIPTGSRARTCPCCRRAVRAGQWVLRDRLPTVDFADGQRLVHVNPCLRTLVETAPDTDRADPTTIDQTFDRLRREQLRALTG